MKHTLSSTIKHDTGFTLVEMAIVLVILGLLLGSILMPLSNQIESNKRKSTQQSLEDIKEAIIGFALANSGRLPCPATPSSAGVEAPAGGGACTTQHGFVPANTLGLSGGRNQDGLLQDAWNNPIRYSVTTADGNAFTTNGSINLTLAPDLNICNTTAGSTATNCAAGESLAVDAVVVVYSLGSDWAIAPVSTEQQENQGGTLGGGPSGLNYPVANDVVFVDRDYNDGAGLEFDDIVTLLSPNILYNRLVAGGVL